MLISNRLGLQYRFPFIITFAVYLLYGLYPIRQYIILFTVYAPPSLFVNVHETIIAFKAD